MASRRDRARNAIRGPQSALTDFLAANNISANQIRQEHERRRAEAERAAAANGEQNAEEPGSASNGAEEEPAAESSAAAAKKKKKQDAAIRKIKESKKFKQKKRQLEGEPGEDDDDEIAFDIYEKSIPLPGQLENCEECGKRFTVTPYSKEGSMGGLLCTKCGKSRDSDRKKDATNKKNRERGEKRRKMQSDMLDGSKPQGAKTLQELCVNVVAKHIHEVDEFGDLPPKLRDRLSQIMSKQRLLTSHTLPLLLGSDLQNVCLYDCGKLEPDDFIKILAFTPRLKKLTLENAGQVKDNVIDYIIEKKHPIESLKLEAPNLVTDEKWRQLFQHLGGNLRELKLTWLDSAMNDETVAHLVENCPNLTYLKLKRCFKLTDLSLHSLKGLTSLQHLFLRCSTATDSEALINLIASIGGNLRTLSIDAIEAADDALLEAIHENCHQLTKLRLTCNDRFTDRALAELFYEWENPALVSLNLSSIRSSDPDGKGDDEDALGGERPLHAGAGPLHGRARKNDSDIGNGDFTGPVHGVGPLAFTELVKHSASRLEHLNLSSCRHIGHGALFDAFTGASGRQWTSVKFMDLSFVEGVDSTILSAIFRVARSFERLVVFGCFSLRGMEKPPPGVAVIGVPNSQDTIWMEG